MINVLNLNDVTVKEIALSVKRNFGHSVLGLLHNWGF